MYNYEHEIANIKDIYLKNYILYDYFHDSIITKTFLEKHGTFVIELSCEREWDYHDIKRHSQDNKYRYSMYFDDCRYLEIEMNDNNCYIAYLNGRFKDSAKLNEIHHYTKKRYYHLRIQLSNGYIDVIFKKFRIMKHEGEIALQKGLKKNNYFEKIIKKFKDTSIDDVLNTARSGEWVQRVASLEYLWLIKNKHCYELALKGLEDKDVRIASAFILGNIGRFECIKELNSIVSSLNDWLIARKHFRDAIDKIIYRHSNL